MRRPKKKYPKGFGAVMILLTVLLCGFLAYLVAEPYLPDLALPTFAPKESTPSSESASSSQKEETPSSSAKEEPPAVSSSQVEERNPQPASADGSLDNFVDWVIWYGLEEPQYPVSEKGTTVYGELFGDPDAQWCAEFLMYCLDKAEQHLGTSYIDEVFPWYPSGYSCGLWFKAYYHWFDAGTYLPEKGDFILFDTWGIGYPDHVGLVIGTEEKADGKTVILTLEGNILTDPEPQIRTREIDPADETIVGFGSIRQQNLGYSGPRKYYSLADKPEEPPSEPENGGIIDGDEAVSDIPGGDEETLPLPEHSSSAPQS